MKVNVQLVRAHIGSYRGLYIGIAFNHFKGWAADNFKELPLDDGGEPSESLIAIGLLFIRLEIKITGKIPTE